MNATRLSVWFMILVAVVRPDLARANALVSTAFTYQGQLKKGGVPVNAPAADFKFTLWDADAPGGNHIATSVPTITSAAVENGLFTIPALDFGTDVFTGEPRWLQIEVCTANCTNPANFSPLTPRQKLTAVPYALQTRGIFVDAVGNVGIGTTSPSAPLDVVASGNQPSIVTSGARDYATEAGQFMEFGHWDGTSFAKRMTIDPNGNVGIGTGSPSARLDLAGELIHRGGALKHYGHDLVIADATRGDGGRALVHWGDGTNEALYINFQNDFNLGTRIDGDLTVGYGGKVGIGTTTPASLLDVAGEARMEGAMFPGGFGPDNAYVGTPGNYLSFGHPGVSEDFIGYKSNTFYFKDSPGGGDTRDPDVIVGGKVGIGTVTPRRKLHVDGWARFGGETDGGGGTDGDYVQIEAKSGTTEKATIRFEQGALRFWNPNAPNAGEIMRISNTGDVGIGTMPSNARLKVVGPAGGVYGKGTTGVHGESTDIPGVGVYGRATGWNSKGVEGAGPTDGSTGVYGWTLSEANVGAGIWGWAPFGPRRAGYFEGNVEITGTLTAATKNFKIDHPLDPENKYLIHTSVESPDMMNIYNGNVTTDGDGWAWVELPAYFDALNKDFRYQLTVIGQFAQAIVGERISNNRFLIRTDEPNVAVSWQVTGIRQDAWANANRAPVEVAKPNSKRGRFLHARAHGMPEEFGLHYEATQKRLQALGLGQSDN